MTIAAEAVEQLVRLPLAVIFGASFLPETRQYVAQEQ